MVRAHTPTLTKVTVGTLTPTRNLKTRLQHIKDIGQANFLLTMTKRGKRTLTIPTVEHQQLKGSRQSSLRTVHGRRRSNHGLAASHHQPQPLPAAMTMIGSGTKGKCCNGVMTLTAFADRDGSEGPPLPHTRLTHTLQVSKRPHRTLPTLDQAPST